MASSTVQIVKGKKAPFLYLAFLLVLKVRTSRTTLSCILALRQMAPNPRLRVLPRSLPETHKGLGIKRKDKTAIKVGEARRPVLLSFNEMPEWFRHGSNKWIFISIGPSQVQFTFRSVVGCTRTTRRPTSIPTLSQRLFPAR